MTRPVVDKVGALKVGVARITFAKDNHIREQFKLLSALRYQTAPLMACELAVAEFATE